MEQTAGRHCGCARVRRARSLSRGLAYIHPCGSRHCEIWRRALRTREDSMALESKGLNWQAVGLEVKMEVGGGSGVVVARVSCCWCPAGSFVDALPAPGNSRALKRCSSAHWSQLEARPVPVCPYARCTLHACLLRRTINYTSLPEPLPYISQHVEHPTEERRNPREEG